MRHGGKDQKEYATVISGRSFASFAGEAFYPSVPQTGHQRVEVEMNTNLSDPEKLRAIADWFDARDDKLPYTGEREIQADLRRIAYRLEESYY